MLAKTADRFLGISAGMKLPEPAGQPFSALKIQKAFNHNVDLPEVVLFVDTFNRQFNPGVAQAAYSILSAAGYHVWILGEADSPGRSKSPLCCGRTYFANGKPVVKPNGC